MLEIADQHLCHVGAPLVANYNIVCRSQGLAREALALEELQPATSHVKAAVVSNGS